MIYKGNQGLIAESGGGNGGDAVIHEQDGTVSDIPGFE